MPMARNRRENVVSVIGNIKRGDILECHFGNYTPTKDEAGKELQDETGKPVFDREHFDTRIPHEIRKTRPVIVLGEHKGQYMGTIEKTEKIVR